MLNRYPNKIKHKKCIVPTLAIQTGIVMDAMQVVQIM